MSEVTEEEIDLIEEWLLSKGVTLWQSWEIIHPESRREAAIWMAKSMNDLVDFVQAKDG